MRSASTAHAGLADLRSAAKYGSPSRLPLVFGDRRELASQPGRNVITDVFILRGRSSPRRSAVRGRFRAYFTLVHVPGGFFLHGVVACRDGR
jgi:hypothetical protein